MNRNNNIQERLKRGIVSPVNLLDRPVRPESVWDVKVSRPQTREARAQDAETKKFAEIASDRLARKEEKAKWAKAHPIQNALGIHVTLYTLHGLALVAGGIYMLFKYGTLLPKL